MREWAEQLVARARAEGVELTGDGGLLTAMVRQVLQTGLEVELASISAMNLMIRRVEGRATPATVRPKTVTTEIGEVELRVPGTATARSSR